MAGSKGQNGVGCSRKLPESVHRAATSLWRAAPSQMGCVKCLEDNLNISGGGRLAMAIAIKDWKSKQVETSMPRVGSTALSVKDNPAPTTFLPKSDQQHLEQGPPTA